jgi:CO/xanthine dehydrogenase Mo-binding subunit
MTMNKHLHFGRRGFLAGTGSLLVAFSIPFSARAQQELGGDLADSPLLTNWIEIRADGTVTVKIGKVELGQGAVTAYAQVAADELDVALDRITMISGDTHVCPDQGTTAGSGSMPAAWDSMRIAAADVRRILLERAASELGAEAAQLTVEDGTVTGPDGRTAAYWDLVADGILEVEATGQGVPKTPDQYRLVGQPVPRLDIPAIMTGQPVFLHDMRPEGMVHARMVYPPSYGATLTALDPAPVEAMPGILAVVRDGNFLGVVAEREDQAEAAATMLGTLSQWEERETMPDMSEFHAWLAAQETDDVVHLETVRSDSRAAAQTVQAEYLRPFHMHASLGTSCAIATYDEAGGMMTVQTHSQSVWSTAEAIAQLLGMEVENVRLQHVQGSGCYGHNMADDAAADAAMLARAVPGRPVRLQYTRAQEHKWEPYGSGMVSRVEASLSDDGQILDYDYQVWSTPHGTRPGGQAGNLLAGRHSGQAFEQEMPGPGGPPNYNSARNAIADYVFPGHRVTDKFVPQMPLRVSSTRSLGAFANVFANESFMDELAHAAGADPVEFRLRHLTDQRYRDVVEAAASAFGWADWQPGDNRGRGFAFARYKNYAAFSAVAVEIEMSRRNGQVRVVRAVCSADAGQIVNPDGLANQIEGGFIQALSWAMKEQVRHDRTRILSEDWASYPILTFTEVPPVQVVLLDRPGQPFLGSGEACCGQAAAAVANAIFDASGVRIRSLPFTPDRVAEAMAS